MKRNFFTVILLLVSLATICSAYAQSGPPPLQEVEATGQGTNADDAFKQAVIDAVRQVVGTLVSAENVIENDRVIKDEVLTLSNGFVEKVLSQEKTKLDDGTWQVKLKCIVRKGQLYGKLQEVKVPTVKFEGVSLFADVVSQLDHQKSSVEMIRNALKKFSPNLVTATMLEEKPKILERDERFTEIEFDWVASVNVDAFFENCAPALDAAFSGAALAKTQKPTFVAVKESKELGIAYRVMTGSEIFFQKEVEYNSMAAIPIARQKNKWEIKFYQIDRRVLEQLPEPEKEMVVVAHFRNSAGSTLLEVLLTSLQFRYLQGENYFSEAQGTIVRPIPWKIDFSFMPLIQSDFQRITAWSSHGRIAARDTVVTSSKVERSFWTLNQRDFVGSSILEHRSSISVPTDLLSKISKVDLSVESVDKADTDKMGSIGDL